MFFSRKRLNIFAFFQSNRSKRDCNDCQGPFFIAAKHNSVQENEKGVFLASNTSKERKLHVAGLHKQHLNYFRLDCDRKISLISKSQVRRHRRRKESGNIHYQYLGWEEIIHLRDKKKHFKSWLAIRFVC